MNLFDELIDNNYLGFYERCDLTKIFIRNKSENKFLTFFTLFEFKEESVSNPDLQKLTENLTDIDDNHSIGIIKKELSLDESKEYFYKLSEGKIDEEIHDIWINGSQLKSLGQYFALNNSTRITDILNFNESGSYIFEFFEEDKSHLKFILSDDEIFNGINDIVKATIGFDFQFTMDRIGNYIFQLPVTLLSLNESFDANELEINFNWNSKLKGKFPACYITISSADEDIYTTNHFVKYNGEDSQTIVLGQKHEDMILSIWLEKEEILLLKKEIPLFLEAEIKVKSKYGFRRVNKNGKYINIPLEFVEENKLKKAKFKQIIDSTKVDIKEKQLKKEYAFHLCGKDNDDSTRYNELIYLINEYGQNGVYIWDMYLTANDLINTAFHLKYRNVPVKAITSKKIFEQDESDENRSIKDIINLNREIIENSDCTGLNLEFRIELGKASFHDRFLIFPPNPEVSEYARVYSLGPSISGFKKSVHIIQMVSVPNDIFKSFNELWNRLDSEDNIIWQNPIH